MSEFYTLSVCNNSDALPMRRYTSILLTALIPLLIINGLAFEAHPQNTLVRISASPGTRPRVLGFIMRDLGGIRVHPPTLRSSTNTPQETFQYLPNHVIVTKTREAAAARLYNTLVQNHLQRLARVLGLHYSGEAWGIVRRHLEREITKQGENGRWLYDFWLREGASEVEGKCLLRMKLVGSYRDVSTF
jgi:siderophore synthetase component